MNEWFFDNSGFAKIKELNDAFKAKAISYANSELSSKYTNYSPWMSNTDNLKHMEPIFKLDGLVLNDRDEVGILEKFYLEGELERKLKFGNISLQEMKLLESAIEIIDNSSNDIKRLFSEVVKHIVPMNTDSGDFQKIGNGFSSHLAKGCLFLSTPKMRSDNELQLAINIAHEVGHQCLYIYQTADKIIKEGINKPIFSQVRKTDRPAIQSFHATVALAFMVRFLGQLKDERLTATDYYKKMLTTLESDFKNSFSTYDEITFSEVGHLLFEDLKNYANSIR